MFGANKTIRIPTTLDFPLLKFSDKPQDFWTLEDAVRGVQIFGGIGSGKTSGSGRTIAKAYLENGFGGLVLCAKPDERENWEKMAKEIGRENDLIIFRKGSKWRFNPLNYETKRESEGGGETFNLVNLFMSIYQMGRNISGEGMARESERFWDNALKRCIRRLVELLKLAKEDVSVTNMHALMISTLSEEEIKIYENITESEKLTTADKTEKFQIWGEENYYIKCLFNASLNVAREKNEVKSEELKREYHLVKNYFNREFISLHERTRTIIVESFLGIAEPFLTGLLHEYFAKDTNIYPEMTFDGKIIIMDFPVKNFLEAGVYAQGIFKLLWQQATERRSFKIGSDRPVFLWVDESQMFLNDYDQIFQTTARSSGACTVFLSQNISNYYAAIGGKDPRPRVDSLLGNLSTKIFHANNDAVTNEWASRTIGKSFQMRKSLSAGEKSSSIGLAEQLHDQVGSADFTILRGGGKGNKYIVDGIITVAGKKWSNGLNYIAVEFSQI